MAQVFISYRQTDEAQRQRVYDFAVKLRHAAIDVILDQFFMEANPGGPNDGWDKWSSDRALKTDYVLIIGTKPWFDCFEKTQPPGTGLGAACEADDLRTRIYDAAGTVSNIRIVFFEESDKAHIPGKLKRYHHFTAPGDINNIIRWLGGTPQSATSISTATPTTTIPHNLPRLQPFFGRAEELRKIAEALDPESRTWGALIDGVGGMGKTSLAVRAAYDAPPTAFGRIVFISLKYRELDDDGLRDLSGFLISGLAELWNELARELDKEDIAKADIAQRPRLLLDALRGTRTLLILDNLESLTRPERDTVFTFVKRLPEGCKAILTARGRIGSGAEELILDMLDEQAALDTLAELATHNKELAKSTIEERLDLYHQTGGKPLLLRWTAGQVGRGHCLTLKDAVEYLRSCPLGNDPLEFIFGDLVDGFSPTETRALCALTYFSLPAKSAHIALITEDSEAETDKALRSLTNRSLIIPNKDFTTYTLIPLVADYLRVKRPEVMKDTGNKLEQRAMALMLENGSENYEKFSVLDEAWPTLAAAMPRFMAGGNKALQEACDSLVNYLNFYGRWDERLALLQVAEKAAVEAGDFNKAGWRAYQAGWVYYLHGNAKEVLLWADRAEVHWKEAHAGVREQAIAVQLRGLGHELQEDYPAAIAAYQQVVDLHRSLGAESEDVAIALNSLASAERLSGDFDAAARDYREGLRMAKAVKYQQGVATCTGNLAALALTREDWPAAEALAREALSLSEEIGRKENIAEDFHRLAQALLYQGKKEIALPHARRAVEIYTELGLEADIARAQATLRQCEEE